MDLNLLRFPLGVLPTPLVHAERLQQAIGCGPVLIKRDDLVGFGGAGNKARPLEYLLGAALADHCDVLVTGGGPASNFIHAAATAARVAGLDCELVIAGQTPLPTSANVQLAVAAGARLTVIDDPQRELVDDAIERRGEALRQQGRHPMVVPRGGSTPLGAVGAACAVDEIARQLDAMDVEPALVVVALGSGGTTAGILAGLALRDLPWHVLAVSVSRPPQEITAHVLDLAQRCGSLLGGGHVDPRALEVVDARPHAGVLAKEEVDRAVQLGLHTEGLLLDPKYTARSFAMAVCRLRGTGIGPVVFWHTGGMVPAVVDLMSGSVA